jgi:hypothetical protein
MPHLISVFAYRNADVFFGRLEIVKQAKLNSSGVLGKESKVHAVAHPCRTKRIRITEEGPHRSHKRAAHLSRIDSALAITNGGATSNAVVIFPRDLAKNEIPLANNFD